jgi:methionine-rich copper-binding protein CopC
MSTLKPLAGLLAAALVVAAVAAPSALASPARAQPQLVEVDPADGAILEAPPSRIKFCFSEPVIQDLDLFRFVYLMPDGKRLGLRIEFSVGNRCLNVYVGLPDAYPAGEYTLEWMVTAKGDMEQASGLLHYQATEARTPTPTPTPSPPEAPAAGASETPSGVSRWEGGDGDGLNAWLIALLAAAAGAVAAAGILGWVFRRALGFGRSRPPEDEEERGHD